MSGRSISFLISKLLKKIQISAIKNSRIDSKAKVAAQSTIVNTNIEKYSYVGNNCIIVNVNIGKYCSIADNCIIGGASHPIEWVSSSPVFHDGANILKKNFSNHQFINTKRSIVGNDVWIGNNVLIKAGVNIGNGSVIGMGAVVTKDIPDYEIWGGNPAKFIRKRFSSEVEDEMKKSLWWNQPDEVIQKLAPFSNDPKKFLKKLEEFE